MKLSLIDDYIKILLIKNFLENNFNYLSMDNNSLNILKSTKRLNLTLEKIYNDAFKQLKMDDLSLLILKKELRYNNSLFFNEQNQNFKNLNTIIKSNFSIMTKIYLQSHEKFKHLKINKQIIF